MSVKNLESSGETSAPENTEVKRLEERVASLTKEKEALEAEVKRVTEIATMFEKRLTKLSQLYNVVIEKYLSE